MVIYADITFIINFLMTLGIIWVVGRLLEFTINWIRLIVAAILGSIYTFVFYMLQVLQLSFFFSCFLHISSNLVTALCIIRVAFPGISTKKYLKAVAFLYLITFSTIGSIFAIFYLNGGAPFNANLALLILVGLIILTFMGKLGWRLLQNYINPEEFYLPLKIHFQKKTVEITGLVDTGNSLHDPLTNVPVLVVNVKDILKLFPDDCQYEIIERADDSLELINLFSSCGLGSRVRVLPFSDLGQEHGILIGFRPDMVELNYQGNIIKTTKIILALSNYKLDKHNEYQALVHPKIIKLQV